MPDHIDIITAVAGRVYAGEDLTVALAAEGGCMECAGAVLELLTLDKAASHAATIASARGLVAEMERVLQSWPEVG